MKTFTPATTSAPDSKQTILNRYYLRMARIRIENSYCQRRQMGALIMHNQVIISDGYNGTPSGFENMCEDDEGITKPYVLHAEANAITKVATSSNNCTGATIYITASPYLECAKLATQGRIRRVVYGEQYRLIDGLELFKRAGVEVVYISLDTTSSDTESSTH